MMEAMHASRPLPWDEPGWSDRIEGWVAAELHRLAAVRDPSAFATASEATAFGAIDVFVLKSAANGDVVWQSVHFRRSQFSPTYFAAFEEPERIVVYVRLGARVSHRSYPQ